MVERPFGRSSPAPTEQESPHALFDRMESAAGEPAARERLWLRSRPGAFVGGRPAFDHPRRRLQRGQSGYRTRRQWRADRRWTGADHRLSDHRGRSGLAASRRWPRGGRPCARLRFRNRFRPGAGAWPHRSRSAAARFFGSSPNRRPRGDGRRRRTHPVGRQPHRRQAGVRRLLGVFAERGDLHLSRTPQLGRHRTDLEPRRVDRHRLAPARARARGQEPSMST